MTEEKVYITEEDFNILEEISLNTTSKERYECFIKVSDNHFICNKITSGSAF